MSNYKAELCALCGSNQTHSLTENHSLLSINSDGSPSNRKWYKVECKDCGLVREGNDFDWAELDSHYTDLYSINSAAETEEHVFFKNGVGIARNKVIAQEIVQILTENNCAIPKHICEVGAGQGNLMVQLTNYFADSSITGVELNKNAVEIGVKKGINLKQGYEFDIEGKHDLIVAITVIEHVPNPTKFLNNIYSKLNDGGYLIIMQPLQTSINYDIFYTDHLWHFGSNHLRAFGNAAGFKTIAEKIDPWFAHNFSIQLLQKDEPISLAINYWPLPSVKDSIFFWTQTFTHIQQKLEQYKGKRIAVFGMSEVFKIVAYFCQLSKFNIVLGIDDFAERHKNNSLGIEVKALNDLSTQEIENIDICLLTMNKVYYNQVTEKCARLGLKTLGLFS